MLDAHDGSFKSALHDYCERLVAPFCKDSFSLLMDYDFIHARVESVGVLQYGYTRNDGEKFLLTIFADRRSIDETMWVCSMDVLPQVELEFFESYGRIGWFYAFLCDAFAYFVRTLTEKVVSISSRIAKWGL